jgi:hypothetical protein
MSIFSTNFIKEVNSDYEAEMTQVVNTMYDKYVPLAYTLTQLIYIDNMIMDSLYRSYCNYKGNDIRDKIRDKIGWIYMNNEVMEQLKTTVGKRKCNDCNKMWYDCNGTCYKPKTNPTPIEFPQDVFNIIKDYMDIVDIPEPVSQLMGMMKLKNLRHFVALRKWGKPIRKYKNIGVNEKVRLYNSKVVYNIKNGNSVWSQQNEKRLLEIANKYPEFRFGKELTDKNKVFLLKLLVSDIYLGVEKDGSRDMKCSLWDIMCGSIGISLLKKIPKKPKPYAMYEQEDPYAPEYDMENNPHNMCENLYYMDKKDRVELYGINQKMLTRYLGTYNGE